MFIPLGENPISTSTHNNMGLRACILILKILERDGKIKHSKLDRRKQYQNLICLKHFREYNFDLT